MSSKGSTGAANGRIGGRLSAAPRLRTALASRPKLSVVSVPAPPAMRGEASSQVLSSVARPPAGALGELMAKAASEAAANTVHHLMSNPAALNELVALAKANQRTPVSIAQPRKKQRAPPAALPAPSPLQPTPQKSLNTGSRGTAVAVVPSVKYGDYTFDDVCHLGARIQAGKLKLLRKVLDQRNELNQPVYGIGYSTMRMWCMDDREWHEQKGLSGGVAGKPHWLVERDVRRVRQRKQPGGVKGGGSLLGTAEKAIIVDAAAKYRKGTPYREEELENIVRDTAIELKLIDNRGNPYSTTSDIRSLLDGFYRRAAAADVVFILKGGRGLSRQRQIASGPAPLVKYRDEVAEPSLVAFQKKHGPLTLLDWGNLDEAQIDFCDFASGGSFVMLMGGDNNVVTPCERAPHMTIVTGFIGNQHLVVMLILIGPEFVAPHPAKAQLLQDQWTVVLAQSPSGWMDNRLKLAFWQLQLACPRLQFGKRPTGMNFDGHVTNTSNLPLTELMQAKRILGHVPPAHTSAQKAADAPSTQQCDKSVQLGGPIACEKAEFRQLMTRQWRAANERKERKGQVSDAEIAALYEKAINNTWANGSGAASERARDLNHQVGYFEEDGLLHFDILRTNGLDDDGKPRSDGVTTAVPPGKLGASRSGARDAQQKQQQKQAAALEKMRMEVKAAGSVMAAANQPVLPPIVHPIGRASKRSKNQFGCVVSSKEHSEQLVADAEARTAKVQKKVDSKENFWANHRQPGRDAEKELKSKGTPSRLSVAQMKEVIVSRTSHCAKPGNKAVVLLELRQVLTEHRDSIIPSTPPPRQHVQAGLEADADDDDDETRDDQPDPEEPMLAGDHGEDPVPTGVHCPGCQAEMELVADGGFHGDYFLRDDTDAYCNYCKTRIPDLDER